MLTNQVESPYSSTEFIRVQDNDKRRANLVSMHIQISSFEKHKEQVITKNIQFPHVRPLVQWF